MTFFSPDMFHLTVPVVEKMARPVLIYIFLVICLRIFASH